MTCYLKDQIDIRKLDVICNSLAADAAGLHRRSAKPARQERYYEAPKDRLVAHNTLLAAQGSFCRS